MKTLLSLAVAAVIGTATFASAEIHFPFPETQHSREHVRFDFVRSDAPGVLEIYDLKGRLLGARAVAPGMNSGMLIPVGHYLYRDALAVLKIDDEVVLSQRVRFER